MTTKTESMAEMHTRADWVLELDRSDDLPEGDAVAVAAMITDRRGYALAVEVGSGDDGVFASIRAFKDEAPVEARVFVDNESTLIVVD